MAQLDALFRELKSSKGSDLHLAAGIRPHIRARGKLVAVTDWPVLDDAGLRDLLREIAPAELWESYENTGDLDFAYGLAGVARFRANYFVQEIGRAHV